MNTPTTTPDPAAVIASARGLVKTYGRGDTAVHALAGIDVDFERGRLTATMGPSGSGKSTLMHCMAGLDRPTAGTVTVDGETVSAMSERGLTKLRRDRLGFVFQAFNLVPTLTALENILLPLDIARRYSAMFDIRIIPLTEPWARRQIQICVRSFDALPTAAKLFVNHLSKRQP